MFYNLAVFWVSYGEKIGYPTTPTPLAEPVKQSQAESGPTVGKFSLDHFSIRRSQWPQVFLHQCNLEWIFNNLHFVFQSLAGFWIPMAGF